MQPHARITTANKIHSNTNVLRVKHHSVGIRLGPQLIRLKFSPHRPGRQCNQHNDRVQRAGDAVVRARFRQRHSGSSIVLSY